MPSIHAVRTLASPSTALALLEAVAAGEACKQKDDDSEQDDCKGHHEFHLEVLAPHAPLEVLASTHEAVSLQQCARQGSWNRVNAQHIQAVQLHHKLRLMCPG